MTIRRWLAPAARALPGLALLGAGVTGCVARPPYPQTYFPATHNWAFRDRYPGADRLFNAFDYGHAVLSEQLVTQPNAAPRRLEGREFERIVGRILTAPPSVPLDEEALAPEFTRLAPEVQEMFEWAHALHRQIYDVWADERIPVREKDAQVGRLIRYYKSRPDLAFSSVPKSMDLMEGQPYSTAFRDTCPKFNGLIWSYHWLQVGLYDALIAGHTPAERRSMVTAVVGRFWSMLNDAPRRMPSVMPMTAAVAPRFASRYPEAAVIFDNLHAMHDVVSDILASPDVRRRDKRRELLTAAARYRDSTSFITTRAEWLEMSHAMGADRMGGVAAP
jgi:hypothetical protein